jgi:hypothetical protein
MPVLLDPEGLLNYELDRGGGPQAGGSLLQFFWVQITLFSIVFSSPLGTSEGWGCLTRSSQSNSFALVFYSPIEDLLSGGEHDHALSLYVVG